MAHTKKNNRIFLLISVVVLTVFVSMYSYSKAEPIDNLEDSEEDSETQKKIEELEKKAQTYREIIEVKQKQQESLNNQISLMNANIYKVETEIEINKRKIEEFNAQISRKQVEIRDKEETILSQKKLLGDLLKIFYEYQQQNVLAILLSNETFEPFMSEKDKLAQTGSKIREILGSVKSLKQKMEEEKVELERNKNELTELHLDLSEKNSYLESNKSQKTVLLTQTQGEEARYQKLLERVEAQKLELLSIDELYATSGLSADDFDKPDKKYHASTAWFYLQQDPKWADTTIGNSKSLLKDYGCAIASVAMVFTKQGESITPKSLAKQPIFSWDLIAWPGEWESLSFSPYGSRHGNINWSAVDSEIKKGNPAIVYIGKSGGKGGHYVVVHNKDSKGRYVVHDPYFGPNLFLDTSRALVGAMGTKTATFMDQMIIYK